MAGAKAVQKPEEIAPGEVWLTKEQAMERLGVGERALQKYARAGKVVRTTLPRGGADKRQFDIALYSVESVEKLKAAREAGLNPRVAEVQTQTKAIAAMPPAKAATSTFADIFGEFLRRGMLAQDQAAAASEIPPHAWMTLREAARHIRMPLAWLKQAVNEGRIPYEQFGRFTRVRRADVEAIPARTVAPRKPRKV